MAISPKCIKCGLELNHAGGLLISPPVSDTSIVDKHHLCVCCYGFVRDILRIDSNRDDVLSKLLEIQDRWNKYFEDYFVNKREP